MSCICLQHLSLIIGEDGPNLSASNMHMLKHLKELEIEICGTDEVDEELEYLKDKFSSVLTRLRIK